MRKYLILLILLLIPLVNASTSPIMWCEVFNGSVIGGVYNEFCYGPNAIYPSNNAPLSVNDSISVVGTVNATAFYDDGVLLTNSGGGNESWNETYADTLYSPINYGDDWNKTYADTLYTNNTDTNTNCSVTDSCTAIVYSTNTSWITTNQGYNTTVQMFTAVNNGTFSTLAEILAFNYFNLSTFNIADYFTSAQVLAFSYYNVSDFDIADYSTTAEAGALYAILGYGDTWNKTYADTLYTNETDTDTNLTEDDVEAYIFDADNTANLDMNGYNITVSNIIMEEDQANHNIYDNASCVVIRAGTTYLEVCE